METIVSCPNCGQQQPVDQFNSYSCDSCDEVWALCTVCSKVLSGDGPDTYGTRSRPLCGSCYLGGAKTEEEQETAELAQVQALGADLEDEEDMLHDLNVEIAELEKQLKGLRELQQERKAKIKKLKEDIVAAGGVFIEE